MLTSAAILASTLLSSPAGAPVVIRHDIPDARYRELARAYPSVCHVGAEGVGVLIAPRWVLTASHVAASVGPFTARVEFGGRGTEQPKQELPVDRVVLHPDYEHGDIRHDIALLRLTRPAKGIDPVPLYTRDDELGQQVVFVGCGDVGTGLTGVQPGDGLWRAATNTVLKVQEDQLRFQFDDPDSPDVTDLEGFWGGGDSGCPAYIHQDDQVFVAAVSSHGLSTDGDGGPGRYGQWDVSYRTSHYAPWIRKVMSTHADSAGDIAAPQELVDGQFPPTPAGELAAAYFDARNSDSTTRQVFAEMFVDLPDGAPRSAIEARIWRSGILPPDLGPYTPLEYGLHSDDSIVVLSTVPQIDEALVFTLRFGPDQPIKLIGVRVRPVSR